MTGPLRHNTKLRPSLGLQILRRVRGALAEAIGAGVHALPAVEGAYVRIGRTVAPCRWAGSLYWHSHVALERRLAASDRRYRRFTIEGLPVALDVTNYTGQLHYFHGDPYEPSLAAVVAGLGPGDVFVDIGANVGFFTLIAALRVAPAGRVIAFEPHPQARATMCELLHRNQAEGVVRIVPAAISDGSSATARLFMSCDSVLSTLDPARSPLAGEYEFDASIEVPARSLDQWMAESGIDAASVTLVKIDVEGTEDDVLRGMEATLAAARPVVVCETTEGSYTDRRLRAAGYTARPLDLHRPAFGTYLYEPGR